jgi:hypothetical protein
MGIQLIKNITSREAIKPAAENSLYDEIEKKCNNCLNNLNNIRKYSTDINNIERYSINPIISINNLNGNIRNIKNKFKNNAFGMFKTFEDASKMAQEKKLKEECIPLMSNIKKDYCDLMNILNRNDSTSNQVQQPEQPNQIQPNQVQVQQPEQPHEEDHQPEQANQVQDHQPKQSHEEDQQPEQPNQVQDHQPEQPHEEDHQPEQ